MKKKILDKNNFKIWWGAPKKFATSFKERKISWLELFFDLVYVSAISKITHHLATKPDLNGFLDYFYLFGMVFWGWLNGSLYYDIHGTSGVRTRFMTLWQMIIIAAFVISLYGNAHSFYAATICLLIMQLDITYLWWSVGFYDKEHREINIPYTLCYLISFGFMLSSLFLEQPYVRLAFYISLFFNYLPPYIMYFWEKAKPFSRSFILSDSMMERLGLLTIILFGETVVAVINGVSEFKILNFSVWLSFVLGMIIVYALWWIFFTIAADHKSKKDFFNATQIQNSYAFALMFLGIFAAAFNSIFQNYTPSYNSENNIYIYMFGVSLSLFLIGVNTITFYIDYPKIQLKFIKKNQITLFITSVIILLITFFNPYFSVNTYLFLVFLILLICLIYIDRRMFFYQLLDNKLKTHEVEK